MRFLSPAIFALAGLTFGAVPTLAQDSETGPNGLPIVGGAEMSPEKTIVGNAVNSADHTTLVAAVEAAGLVDTLTGPGPFTVFAPIDAAFDALPAGTVDTLLLPQNGDALRTVLTCHVVSGDLMRKDILERLGDGPMTLDTVGGCPVDVAMNGDVMTLTDPRGGTASITIRDVEQLNGVIHVIDAVLLPAEDAMTVTGEAEMTDDGMRTDNPMVAEPSGDTVATLVASADDLTRLAAAIETAGLSEALSGTDPVTVFAPNDAAFEAAGSVPQAQDALRKLILAHAVPGRLTADDLAQARRADGFVHLTTLSGDALSIQLRATPPMAFDESGNVRRIVETDRQAANGVVHIVDGVLLPR